MEKLQRTNIVYFMLPIFVAIGLIAGLFYFLPAHEQMTKIERLEVEAPIPPQLYSSSYHLIGTGNKLGTYYPLGKILADYFNNNTNINETDSVFKAIETNGSIDNVKLLEAGNILLGMSESRIVKEAYLKDSKNSKLRLVWPLWYDIIHVLKTPEKYENKDLFPGRLRAYLGQEHSSTLRTSEEILKALKSPRSNFPLNSNEVIPSLSTGRIGFAVIQAGMPNTTVADAILFNNCALYSFSDEAIDKILKQVSTSKSFIIPARTYGAQQETVQTIAIPNVLVASADTPAETVNMLTSLLVKGSMRMKLRYSTLETLPVDIADGERILKELEIPLHEGTIDFLELSRQELNNRNKRNE
ncbi:MAG: hypothetical protein BWY02_00406 [bacterium ADurb.Bin157]|nr:MAG: hypothetical protein BWY02_00406 [bacterium ADurb.Bin157]